MKSKLSLIVISTLVAIAVAGCSKKSTNANANSSTANSNTTATTLETTNYNETGEMTDDSSTSPSNKARSTGKTTGQDKTANSNAPMKKPTPEREPPVKSTEKQVTKQGDRIIRDSGGLVKEGERRVRGILNGKP